MNLVDYIIIVLVLAVLGLSALCIYKSKKSGKKCIGCPDSCACSNTGCGGCDGHCHEK